LKIKNSLVKRRSNGYFVKFEDFRLGGTYFLTRESLNLQKSSICVDERSENKRLNFSADQRGRNES